MATGIHFGSTGESASRSLELADKLIELITTPAADSVKLAALDVFKNATSISNNVVSNVNITMEQPKQDNTGDLRWFGDESEPELENEEENEEQPEKHF